MGWRGRGFFPMERGDRLFLVALLVLSAVAFLPAMRRVEPGGLALLGWLMAALMVLSPMVALVRLWRGKRRAAKGPADRSSGETRDGR
jgi:hypothetical protein